MKSFCDEYILDTSQGTNDTLCTKKYLNSAHSLVYNKIQSAGTSVCY